MIPLINHDIMGPLVPKQHPLGAPVISRIDGASITTNGIVWIALGTVTVTLNMDGLTHQAAGIFLKKQIREVIPCCMIAPRHD